MWLGVYLLYCVLQESSGCTVERGKGPDITGSLGDTVVLPCACDKKKPVDPQTVVQWGYRKEFKLGDYRAEHSVFPKDSTQNQRYKDRVQRPDQVSLRISNITEDDGGTYVCGNPNYNRAINLYVGGCSMVGEQHTVTRSPGESVLLPCPCSSTGHVKPERVTWSYSKTDNDQTVSIDKGSYRGRVWTFDQTGSRNLSLLISDLTKEDAGRYICTSDKHTSSVYLRVKGCALVENKQTVKVNRSAGESVLLSCTCPHLPGDSPVTVQWRGPHQEDLLQRSRVQTFTKTSPGNLSVLISDLTVKDGGTYSCWINQNQYRNFTLTVKDCTLSPTQEKQITRYPGQSVLLPCSCTDPHTRPGSVKWERVDSGGTEVSNKTGRVQMFNKSHPANLSLLISDLTEQDQGTYRCSINNKQPINISLIIKGCTLSQTQEEPFTRYPGESVLLPCSCTDPDTRPGSVKWERVDSGGTEVSSKAVIYSDRVQKINENHPSNLSLLISDLTEQDQGTYRCSVNNQSISIRLSITGCTLSQTQENQIIRYPGESVLLPCSCNDTKTRPLSVKWERVDSGETKGSSKMEIYSDRVQMFNKSHPSNLSLLISNLTEQDQDTYRCSINDNQSISIRLSITGCTLSQNQTNQIIRYPGQSVLLPCSCTDPNTRPLSVKWERVDSGGTEGSSKMELSSDRVQMFNNSYAANLSLLISNLTEQDQGTYRCSINNNQSVNIRLSITGCTLSQTQENPISRYPGQYVLLPCSCTDPKTRPLSVKWEHVDSGGTEGSSKMEIYSDRVQMFNKSHPGDLSLLISNLTEQDQGTYRCSINHNQSINISLSITGCTLSQTQENQIIGYPRESVLLPCSCNDTQTRPLSFQWERVDSGGNEGSSKTVNYSDRVQMFNKSHPADLSLLIFNLTEQDQGTYRCSINNNQSINISLNISVKAGTSRSTTNTTNNNTTNNSLSVLGETWVIIIIICALLLILLLLLGGAACTYRKHVQRRKQRKDKDTGQRTNQEDITYTTVTHRGSGNKPQKQDNVIYSPVAHGKKDTPAEDDVTYSTLVHGKKGKTPPAKDDVTYASVAHGKDQQANTEDEVTYSSVVHSKKGKKPKGQKKAEEDVMYSDVAFCRAAKSGDQDQVTFSKGPEEPTLYASVKPGKK